MLNERYDDITDSIARRACTAISHAQVVGDEALDSQGKLSHKDDDGNLALDDFYDTHSDQFRDTGYISSDDIIPENAGVRGPQSESILYPRDCKKLLHLCRGIKVLDDVDANMNSFHIESLREEANFIHADAFNVLRKRFSDVFQLHRLLQLRCVKDWLGWQ